MCLRKQWKNILEDLPVHTKRVLKKKKQNGGRGSTTLSTTLSTILSTFVSPK